MNGPSMRIPTRIMRAAAVVCAAGASFALLQAQGRGGGEWTTAAFDAQRTAWVPSDSRLTKDAVTKGEFKFLWKQAFNNEAHQLNSLTEPVLLDRLIGFRGFKALAFIGGSADRVFSIDTDLGRPYWTVQLNYSATTGGLPVSSAACPGGLIATPSRRTVLAPSTFGRGGGGRGARGVRNGSAVGEPGQGAAVLQEMAARAGARAAAPAPQPPAARGNGGRGRGPAAVPFGGVDPVFVMGSDGMLHTLLSSNGADAEPAVPFLPPSAKPSALIWVDGVVYASTSDHCGAAPNGVWALDLTADGPERKTVSWSTGGPNVAGSTGPALGTDGTVYVATAKGPAPSGAPAAAQGEPASYANSVVALEGKTLKPKDWFTADAADFNTSPVVIRQGDRDLVAAAGNDGRLYLLDGAKLGGADHKTPLFVTPKFTQAGAGGGLATWEDGGTRWILATTAGAPQATAKFAGNGPVTAGSVVAFKLVDQGGTLTLEPGWASRDLVSPLAPIVVNGVVFAASSGEARGGAAAMTAAQRAQRSTPAVLYALDGATGKTLWSSGQTITSFARARLSAGSGQVYLVTYDNTLYTFGIPMEH